MRTYNHNKSTHGLGGPERQVVKYAAAIKTSNATLPVFPRSKKTTLFGTLKAAESKLNTLGRKLGENAQGRIYSVNNGKRTLVFTIAL